MHQAGDAGGGFRLASHGLAAWDGHGWRLPAVAPPVPAESRLLQLLLGGGFLYVLASSGQALSQTLA